MHCTSTGFIVATSRGIGAGAYALRLYVLCPYALEQSRVLTLWKIPSMPGMLAAGAGLGFTACAHMALSGAQSLLKMYTKCC